MLGNRSSLLLGTDAQADRRIERWRHDGLGPLMDGAPDTDAHHYAALAGLGGRGTMADTTALRMARQGFVCRRYQDVLWREWMLEKAIAAPTDPYETGEGVMLDTATALLEGFDQPAAGPLDQIFRGMLAGVRRTTTEAGRELEAALGDMVALAMGGLPIEKDNPVGGHWPHVSPEVKPWGLPPGPSPLVQVAVVVRHYLPEVVENVPVVEAMLATSKTTLDDDVLGDVAALLAPMQVLWSRRFFHAARAWARTGGAWKIDYDGSTPQFAMVAEVARPDNNDDHAPENVGAAVTKIGGPPEGPRDEQLVLRRASRPRLTTQ